MRDNAQVEPNPEIIKRMRRSARLGIGTAVKLSTAIFAWQDSARGEDQTLKYRDLMQALRNACGKPLDQLVEFEEFWTPAVGKAVEKIFGNEDAKRIQSMLRLHAQQLFYQGFRRRSYRSSRISDHIQDIVMCLSGQIVWAGYGIDVCDAILKHREMSGVSGFADRLAERLFAGDATAEAACEEAIFGDNQLAMLSHTMIEGIVKSGNRRLIEMLGKLLLAAQQQEGLRQAILERMDSGSVETSIYFLELILENNMTRFSSVIRAMDTWTGLGFGNEKPAVAEKCLRLAYENLRNPQVRERGMESPDVLELYFALWAEANYDFSTAAESAKKLLAESGGKYRRLTALYFLTHSENERESFLMAANLLRERDEEVLAWVAQNLYVSNTVSCYWRYGEREARKPQPESEFPKSSEARRELFDALEQMFMFIGGKKRIFQGSVFPWISIELNSVRVSGCMLSLAAYDMDHEMIDRLKIHYLQMGAEYRQSFCNAFLDPVKSHEDRRFLWEALNDKSTSVREIVVKRLKEGGITDEDMDVLASALRTRNARLRKLIIETMEEQPESLLLPALERMRASGDDAAVQAALELSGESRRGDETEAVYSADNGYGLFDPNGKAFQVDADFYSQEGLLKQSELSAALSVSKGEILNYLKRVEAVFLANQDYEYEAETYGGQREKVLLGNMTNYIRPVCSAGKPRTATKLCDYPLEEQWRAACGGGEGRENIKWLLAFLAANSCGGLYGAQIENHELWFSKAMKGIPLTVCSKETCQSTPYYSAIVNLTELLLMENDETELFHYAFAVYRSLRAQIDPKHWNDPFEKAAEQAGAVYFWNGRRTLALEHRYLLYWRRLMIKCAANSDELFRIYFQDRWNEYLARNRERGAGVSLEDVARACELGIVSADAVYEQLLTAADAANHINAVTQVYRWCMEFMNRHPWLGEFRDAAVDRILEIEEKRGELCTPLTELAMRVGAVKGANHFANLLAALGNEDFHRGYLYGNDTKKAVLSSLMKRCFPRNGEGAAELAAQLSGRGITEKRLVQAALYAPQWAGAIESIVGWEGLRCAVWFFHAHISEIYSAEKETEVALWSPIPPSRFNAGVFDREWFFRAWNTLGEKRFDTLYKYAKYITDGSAAHRRSQLYADAVLGRLSISELEEEIRQKRNQEKLRTYPLIPMEKGDKREALRRYEFIQAYLKESKKFGSQRRASEETACGAALSNLAEAMGCRDVDRMVWSLESEKYEAVRPMLQEAALDKDVTVRLAIDSAGVPELEIKKGGRVQKTLPKAYAKDEYVINLKETVKQLRDQRSRAVKILENAMIDCTFFEADELLAIGRNPVLSALIRGLIWSCGAQNGFLTWTDAGLSLKDALGTEGAVEAGAQLKLAHPHDLRELGCWGQYQKALFQQQLTQPFKQVFREYYPLTEEEREARTVSRRYAGNQVQPVKAAALLKSRRWTVDYMNGLQRVYYKEQLVATMFSVADWFSPSDIEAPAIETVEFFDMKAGSPAALEAVPPILFSETMRDIDLAVSAAHAGGVDPEASHSTMDMRIAIAGELLTLMGISNVEFSEAHAKISGSLGSYSVHMGSGVVHQTGVGMIAILPVYSQARGRIFLPFADSDPKTAEIMSKIVLLAQDNKIKDPGILSQIGL